MGAGKQTVDAKRISLKGIQQMFFRTQLILIISLALILSVAGIALMAIALKKGRKQYE